MRLKTLRPVLWLVMVALTQSACQRDATTRGGSTPSLAVQGLIDHLARGDFAGLWRSGLPPADYATLRADWNRRARDTSPAARAGHPGKWDAALQQLGAPQAQVKLSATVPPALIRLQQRYGDQLPVLISIGGAFARNNLKHDADLSPTEQFLASQLIDTLTPWAQQAPWFDPAKARQAIGIAVATARAVQLGSIEQWHRLDFDTAMARSALAWNGARRLLLLYGLSVDATLHSVTLTELSRHDSHAVVRMDYRVLGKPLTAQVPLVQLDGRWYSQDLLDNAHAWHRRALQSTVPVPSSPTAMKRTLGEDRTTQSLQ